MSALVGADAAKASRLLQVRDVLLDRAARDAKRGDHAVKRQMLLIAQQFPNLVYGFLTAFSYRFFLTAFF